ncbi:MAG TPA: hypothetical protein ENI23_01840 [bacterium]|nr:hypothetical protein [bacterium]
MLPKFDKVTLDMLDQRLSDVIQAYLATKKDNGDFTEGALKLLEDLSIEDRKLVINTWTQ